MAPRSQTKGKLGKERTLSPWLLVKGELFERRAQFQAHRSILWPHCKISERAVRLDEAETRGSVACSEGRRAHRARPCPREPGGFVSGARVE